MTYKTRQEVLRVAADWMDVYEKAGVKALVKNSGSIYEAGHLGFSDPPHYYEFPLALLEGKEVWVGSELYDQFGEKVVCSAEDVRDWSKCSWSKPKPKTVSVILERTTAEELLNSIRVGGPLYKAISKSLEE